MVIDYRLPNSYIAPRRFKYETLLNLAPQLRPGDRLLSWDIKDAFCHLQVRPRDRTYLCFTILGRVFEPLLMPFGLHLAPFLWTKVYRPVVGMLRRKEYRVVVYVDGFGGAPPSLPGQADALRDAEHGGVGVRQMLGKLGLTLHPRDCV